MHKSVLTMLGTKTHDLQSYLPTKTKNVFHGSLGPYYIALTSSNL